MAHSNKPNATVRNFLRFAMGLAIAHSSVANGQSLTQGELLFVASDVYSSSSSNDGSKASTTRADELFEQSRQAATEGEIGNSLQLATRAVREDPNHADARRVLGYRRVAGEWAGSFAARRLERGEVWNQQYGWINAEELPRWDSGERKDGKRWFSTNEDIHRHANIKKGWQVRTDHFLVTTNHSRQAAAELATRLEVLHQVWQQMFGGFYLEQSVLLRRFEGQTTSGHRSKPFRVTYYKSRDQYNNALLRQQPRIGMTLGIYFDTDRSTHFFAGDEQDAGTIYHEAVHQFFQESAPAARSVGGLANAWLVEGIACYFESLARHDDPELGEFYSLGTPTAGRLPAARHRRLVDDYYVPLAELSALGTTDLQRRSDIARLYSQSSGLATFLVHGREGAYRPALVELLQLVYQGRDRADSLEQLTGQSFAELDRQYLAFLRSLPQ